MTSTLPLHINQLSTDGRLPPLHSHTQRVIVVCVSDTQDNADDEHTLKTDVHQDNGIFSNQLDIIR